MEERTYEIVAPEGDIVFNGTEDQVIQWLNNKSDEIRSLSHVGATDEAEIIPALDFIKKHNEELIRRIIREELKALLTSLGKTADELDTPYETKELESRSLQIVRQVAEAEAGFLPHTWDCPTRDPRMYNDLGNQLECTCGVGDKDDD